MSGKAIPEIIVTTEEVSEAFKRSGFPTNRFAEFDTGYRLGKQVQAEGRYLESEQCSPTDVAFASGGRP